MWRAAGERIRSGEANLVTSSVRDLFGLHEDDLSVLYRRHLRDWLDRTSVDQVSMTSAPIAREPNALTRGEALMVANQYFGTDSGYLGRNVRPGGSFSYRSLTEFYPEYCGVDVNPHLYEGTTREKFVAVLYSVPAGDQLKILKTVIRSYPPCADDDVRSVLLSDLQVLIKRLENSSLILGGDLRVSSDAVRRALEDAETLMRKYGTARAIDRMHTLLHAYLRAACATESIKYEDLAPVRGLLEKLEREHPKLADLGVRSQELTTILNSLGPIAGALDPIRNNACPAHANPDLLREPEAPLVISTVRALYFYLDAKLG